MDVDECVFSCKIDKIGNHVSFLVSKKLKLKQAFENILEFLLWSFIVLFFILNRVQ